jgi:hypothetical protein
MAWRRLAQVNLVSGDWPASKGRIWGLAEKDLPGTLHWHGEHGHSAYAQALNQARVVGRLTGEGHRIVEWVAQRIVELYRI